MQYLLPLKLLPLALILLSTTVSLLAHPHTGSLDGQGGIAHSEAELEDTFGTRIRRWLWWGKADDNETTPTPVAAEEEEEVEEVEEEEEDLEYDIIPTTAKPGRMRKWWHAFKAVAKNVGSGVKEKAKKIKVKFHRGYNKTKKGFRYVKLKVKKGYNITKHGVKSAFGRVKRLFTKEEKFSVFANHLKDKVEAGDVNAIKFLEKLGIGLAFEGGKVGNASIKEEVSVVEVLNKEGLAKPNTTEEVTEEEEEGGEEFDEEDEVSDKGELIEGPDTWSDSVDCSITCLLNKTEEGSHTTLPPTTTHPPTTTTSITTTTPTSYPTTTSASESPTTPPPPTTSSSTTSTTTTTVPTISKSTTVTVPVDTGPTTTTPPITTIPKYSTNMAYPKMWMLLLMVVVAASEEMNDNNRNNTMPEEGYGGNINVEINISQGLLPNNSMSMDNDHDGHNNHHNHGSTTTTQPING